MTQLGYHFGAANVLPVKRGQWRVIIAPEGRTAREFTIDTLAGPRYAADQAFRLYDDVEKVERAQQKAAQRVADRERMAASATRVMNASVIEIASGEFSVFLAPQGMEPQHFNVEAESADSAAKIAWGYVKSMREVEARRVR